MVVWAKKIFQMEVMIIINEIVFARLLKHWLIATRQDVKFMAINIGS
jgi:hypothetical protein